MNLENPRHGFCSEWAQLSSCGSFSNWSYGLREIGGSLKGYFSRFTVAVRSLNLAICLSNPGIWGFDLYK
jgi:hypothetical protein